MRIERDSIGTLEIPSQAYYGIHSQRAAQNFAVTTQKVHPLLLKKLILIKMAAAEANYAAGQLTEKNIKRLRKPVKKLVRTLPTTKLHLSHRQSKVVPVPAPI